MTGDRSGTTDGERDPPGTAARGPADHSRRGTEDDSRVDRRAFLASATAVGALASAGCTALQEHDGQSDGTDDAGAPGGDEPSADGDTPTEGEDPDDAVALEPVADGLEHPWAIAVLPRADALLVTERPGRLQLVDRETGDLASVAGVPDVHAADQGGLLDVALHPSFPDESWVYLTYAATNDAGESATHVGRGRLDADEPALSSFEVLHVAEPFVDSDGHYGSRAVFGDDGALYVTVGDRQFKDFGPDHVSQDPSNELGATLRLESDGTVPTDNPFLEDPDAADTVYSYGHRNAQGAAVHPETGELWLSEHGEADGDELDVVQPGANYGWPIASEACHYGTTDPVGQPHDEVDDVVAPAYTWPCSTGGFAPAGATFYDGDAFLEWRGDLFVGNLADRYLGRFAVEGHAVEEREPLLTDRGWRIRDVTVAPDTGALYVAVDAGSAPIVRLIPADGD